MRKLLKKLEKKLEAMLSAAAFAEGGEAETARQVLAEADRDDAITAGGAPRPKRGRGASRFHPREKVARLP